VSNVHFLLLHALRAYLITTSWISRTFPTSVSFDEEHLFLNQIGHLATVLAGATVCWYAFLMPEEDLMEGL